MLRYKGNDVKDEVWINTEKSVNIEAGVLLNRFGIEEWDFTEKIVIKFYVYKKDLSYMTVVNRNGDEHTLYFSYNIVNTERDGVKHHILKFAMWNDEKKLYPVYELEVSQECYPKKHIIKQFLNYLVTNKIDIS